MTGVRTLEVGSDEGELRLDRWFRRHFPGLGHGRLEKLLRTGQVRVDGGRAKGSTRLAAGMRIRVPPLGEDAETAAPRDGRPGPVAKRDERAIAEIKALVIHRDDDVLAINKPPGLAVQGGTGLTKHLDAMLDDLRFGARERPRLVHRLDRDTSGVLVLGRNAAAASKLAAAFRGRSARKIYWALVVGVPKPRQGRISLDLAKTATGQGERVTAGEDEAARHAVTDYAVLQTAGDKVAWLALRPLTGRTHQLRVHCAEGLHTPILGDGKYAGKAAFLAGAPQARTLHLHARSLEIPHPRGGTLRLVADLPPALAGTWKFFGFAPGDAFDPFD
jgi:23S rRNA pseudouridine955/2504/2580 synthase